MTAASLRVDVGAGLVLDNPVIAASGTFGYGVEYGGVADVTALGAVVVKGISLRPSPGHPPPRMVETAAGMLNAIGLQNVGLERFVAEKLPWLRERSIKVVDNCWGNTVEEYAEVVAARRSTWRYASPPISTGDVRRTPWLLFTGKQRSLGTRALCGTRSEMWARFIRASCPASSSTHVSNQVPAS